MALRPLLGVEDHRGAMGCLLGWFGERVSGAVAVVAWKPGSGTSDHAVGRSFAGVSRRNLLSIAWTCVGVTSTSQ